MADVFVSYARSDKARVAPLVAAIEAKGWSVWWDPEITPGQEFDDQIDAEINAAKAVLVIWTPVSVSSRWVRGEAREAADRNILVPVRFEGARLPMDVRAIHTTDLDGWGEDPASAQAQEFLRALAAMIARTQAVQSAQGSSASAAPSSDKPSPRFSICVLPFTNMSGEPEQEYFSDGITEDIITDLSKVSALRIIARNNAFMYKGKNVDVSKVAREMKVTHVLEGSVRKAGGRVRISAQLVDGENNGHVWAERYDRDASDIFAIQDEISQAIVKALKLRLWPAEKKAIERRGTDSADAHNLYLMARQAYITGQEGGDAHAGPVIVRICKRATEIDPNYAEAWALMATGFRQAREFGDQGPANEAMVTVERALALNPGLAEAHAVKAQIHMLDGDVEAASVEVATALKLDPESYQVNRSAGRLNYQLQKFYDAIRCYEKTVALMELDVNSAAMLISCYTAVSDAEGTRRSAQLTLNRAEAVLAHDQNNAVVTAYSVDALAALGETERAKARMERAMLIDPDNWNMRYNFACMLSIRLKDKDAALALLGPLFETMPESFLDYTTADPDLEILHDDPRYQAMVAAAETRLAAEAKKPTAKATPDQ
ncbi:MAG: TIR domain-containing protein [Gammaproteobacteria bacterium]